MPQAAPSYFRKDYWAARQLILKHAAARKAAANFIPHPHSTDEPIGIDVLQLGDKDSAHHIVLCSATHGVEGYAGSALQSCILDRLAGEQLPDNVCVTFIHALNPWGFANDRRVNENNVDLNRNFIDHSQNPPRNAGYEQLDAAINPPDLGEQSLKSATEQMRAFVKKHGGDALQAAISKGQYHKPDGCYYGGNEVEWSNHNLRYLIETFCDCARTLLFIDVHTGLGKFGVGELIVEFSPDNTICKTARTIWGEDVTSTQDGSSSSAALAGTIDFAVVDAAPQANVIPITLEYGTVSSQQVFEAMRADNWLHHNGDLKSEQGRKIKADLRAAFYPEQDDWKQMVIDRGCEVFDQALGYLSSSD